MARPRLSDAEKRLHNTLHKRPAPPSLGTPRIAKPIPPPGDLSPELARQWKLHMAMVLASGRMASVDLLAFAELVKAAHLADIGYAAAIAEGPTVLGDKGQTKTGSAWRGYLIASANYRTWLDRFGLTPRARMSVAQLPAPTGGLHVVGGGRG